MSLGGTEPLPTQKCFPQPNITTTFTMWWAGPSYHFRDLGWAQNTRLSPRLHPKVDALVLAQPGQGATCPTSVKQEGEEGGGPEPF